MDCGSGLSPRFDRAVFTDGSLPQKVYDVLFSPDDKYVAWTIYDSSSGLPIGSKILELSSGAIVAVPEMEVIGWSVQQQIPDQLMA